MFIIFPRYLKNYFKQLGETYSIMDVTFQLAVHWVVKCLIPYSLESIRQFAYGVV